MRYSNFEQFYIPGVATLRWQEVQKNPANSTAVNKFYCICGVLRYLSLIATTTRKWKFNKNDVLHFHSIDNPWLDNIPFATKDCVLKRYKINFLLFIMWSCKGRIIKGILAVVTIFSILVEFITLPTTRNVC